MISLEAVYKKSGALLEGHFLLSSGNHSSRYLQSAKVLENPKTAAKLANALADLIRQEGLAVDTVCAPALGGILAGYELARALEVRSIFTERVDGVMTLRRGFEVQKGEKVLICEDIITTGGSALEAAQAIERAGGSVVGFAALANRGFCKRVGSDTHQKT
jgi:orotate phosphoribosyltransferase